MKSTFGLVSGPPGSSLVLPASRPHLRAMQVAVASLDAATRATLQARALDAGLAVSAAVESGTALGKLLESDRGDLVLAGAHWPEVETFLIHGVASNTPVALLLDDDGLRTSHPAVRRGASAVLPWNCPARSLAAAVESVLAGLLVLPAATWIPAPLPSSLEPPPSSRVQRLSTRERDVLALIANGLPTKQIARRLALSPNTIKHHLASAFAKLDARTRAGAVSEAIRRGELAL